MNKEMPINGFRQLCEKQDNFLEEQLNHFNTLFYSSLEDFKDQLVQ